MPTLHRFDNCVIRVYAGDHLPPHFHIGMNAGRVIRREIAEPLAWAQEKRAALHKTWKELNR